MKRGLVPQLYVLLLIGGLSILPMSLLVDLIEQTGPGRYAIYLLSFKDVLVSVAFLLGFATTLFFLFPVKARSMLYRILHILIAPLSVGLVCAMSVTEGMVDLNTGRLEARHLFAAGGVIGVIVIACLLMLIAISQRKE